MTKREERTRGRALGRGPRALEASEASSAEGTSTLRIVPKLPRREAKNHETMRTTVERWRREEAESSDEAHDDGSFEDSAEGADDGF